MWRITYICRPKNSRGQYPPLLNHSNTLQVLLHCKQRNKQTKTCIKKAEVAESITRNLGNLRHVSPSAWRSALNYLSHSLILSYEGVLLLLLLVKGFVVAWKNSYLNQCPQWTILKNWDHHLIVFPLFWLAYSPMSCLQIFNQIQHLRKNNCFLRLSQVLFTTWGKNNQSTPPTFVNFFCNPSVQRVLSTSFK